MGLDLSSPSRKTSSNAISHIFYVTANVLYIFSFLFFFWFCFPETFRQLKRQRIGFCSADFSASLGWASSQSFKQARHRSAKGSTCQEALLNSSMLLMPRQQQHQQVNTGNENVQNVRHEQLVAIVNSSIVKTTVRI